MNENKGLLQNEIDEGKSFAKIWQSSKYHKALGKNYTNDLYGIALNKGNCFFNRILPNSNTTSCI